MSYLASPLWLALILIGLGLSLQARFVVPDYFPHGLALFPAWPIFDPQRALRLFGFTMAVLLLPKVLGTALVLADSERRRAFGGGAAVVASLVAEIFLSSLMAPVMMLVQTLAVASIVMGRDAGWAPQNRADGGLAFSLALSFHARHMIFGLVLAAAAVAVSPSTALWMLPVVAGLVLAGPLTWFTASPASTDAAPARSASSPPRPSSLLAPRARASDAPMGIAAGVTLRRILPVDRDQGMAIQWPAYE